jgi:hypothetical protein
MASKKRQKESPAQQSARFIETARKLGADERPEEFAKILKSVASKKKSHQSR